MRHPIRNRFRKRVLGQFEPLEARHLLTAQPIISEFQAANDTTLLDGDGNASDWIEVYNAGDAAINLAGWHLTDDANNLNKWQFPATELAPDEYLIVFASGQSDPAYLDAAGKLHTNFQLSRDGEYLALVEPDGRTVVAEFAPAFPQQITDVSYGLTNGRETEFVVDIGAPTAAFVPSNSSLGTNWTTVTFDDDDWISGTMGVGYEQLEAGYVERDDFDAPLGPRWEVDIPASGTSTVSVIAGGRLRTNVPAGQNMLADRGLAPLVLQDLPEQNSDFQFTTRVSTVSGGGYAGITLFDSLTQQNVFSVQFNSISSFLTKFDTFAGTELVIPKFEFNTTAVSLRIARNSATDSWTTSYRLDDGSAWTELVTVAEGSERLGQINPTHIGLISRTEAKALVTDFQYAELAVADEQPFYGRLSGLAVEGEMFGANASVYTRIPFSVTGDLSRFAEMDLAVQYDDGFIAYLNGTEIARRNAPAGATWNSAATDVHGAIGGQISTEVVNVDTFVDQLRVGENVLAIHGLNVAADDRDFFLSATLGAINPEGESTTGYFTSPTPGAANPGEVSPLGPTVSDVTHSPNIPTASDPVVVTARLSPATPFAVAGGSVVYRAMYGAEISVPMVDDGTGNDQTAGDGIFTGVIPAGVAQPGEMLRYWIESRDTRSNTARSPIVDDTTGTDRSPEYYGTVIADPAVMSDLTILHWFAENPAGGRNRTGTRASVFYAGEFYDNVYVRQRGGATNGASQKFNFNSRQPFFVNDKLGRVLEFNLNANGSDAAFVRQPLAFESYSDIGNPSSVSFLTRVELNGGFDRVGVFIEQVDEDYIERNGLDRDGALYKFVQRSTLEPVFNDTTTGIEKKTRLDEGFADLQALVAGLNLPTIEERRVFMLDNLNLPSIMNYLAIRSITMDADDVRKNFYGYRDTNGTGEWSIFPWDKDWTFGVTGDGGTHLTNPFFGDEAHSKQNANQWNKLYDDLFADPITREMYLRRLRSAMDELLQSGELGAGEVLRYEARVDELLEQARGDLSSGAISAVNAVKNFFPSRRQQLYEEHSIDNLSDGQPTLLVGEASDQLRYFVPTNNSLGLSWTGVAAPANINAWQSGQGGFGYEDTPGDYAEFIGTHVRPGDACGECTSIYTRMPFEVDNVDEVRALTLRLQYDDGYVAYLNGTQISKSALSVAPGYDTVPLLGIQSSGLSVRDINVSQHIGLLNEGTNMLAIHSFNRTSTDSDQLLLAKLWNGSFEVKDVAGIPHEQIGNPTITFGQIEYNPTSGNQDEEFIELVNDNNTSVDISGWRLVGGVEHVFASGTVIPAGWSLYVAPSVTTFRARQTGPSGGQSLLVQGDYSGHIASSGETIRLLGIDNQTVSTVDTPVDPTNVEQAFLRVSELNYNPVDGGVEFIELVNVHPTDTVDASGVVFSQGPSEPFSIPAGTSITAGGRLVIAKDPAALRAAHPELAATSVVGPFEGSLSNGGERIKFDSANGETLIDFDYSDNELWPQSADGLGSTLVFLDPVNDTENYSHYYGWRASSFVGGSPGATDVSPTAVWINEVLSNTDAAPDVSDAIELFNPSDSSVDISGWFLSDSRNNLLKFQIPTDTVLAPGGFVVFDESDFNPTPDTPGERDFALSGSAGDDVWLVVPDGAGGVKAFIDEVHFNEASSLVSFGRVSGSNVLVPMGRTTLGAANNQPTVGDMVISEVFYHPGIPSPEAVAIERELDQNDLEFIEIYNATNETADLLDWRIRGGVDIDFAAGTALDAGATLLVLSFDPTTEANADKAAAFRVHHGLGAATQLVGGYTGSLSDSDARIRLQQRTEFPGVPAVVIGHVDQDQIIYADQTPWPTGTDGMGNSLQRQLATSLGNDPQRWSSATPTPGEANLVGTPGDFDGDGRVTARDIDMLYNAKRRESTVVAFDLDGSGTVGDGDVTHLLRNVLNVSRGDVNLDGKVNPSDLNVVGINWQRTNGAGWADGDFNGDGSVTVTDLNVVGINWLTEKAAFRTPRAALGIPSSAIQRTIRRSATTIDESSFTDEGNIGTYILDGELAKSSGRRQSSLRGRRTAVSAHDLSRSTQRIDEVFADLEPSF